MPPQIQRLLDQGQAERARQLYRDQAWPNLFERYATAAAGGDPLDSSGGVNVNVSFALRFQPHFDALFGGREGGAIADPQSFRAACHQVRRRRGVRGCSGGAARLQQLQR
jgi:hypothetical protein